MVLAGAVSTIPDHHYWWGVGCAFGLSILSWDAFMPLVAKGWPST
jgi:hypothetical protein